VRVTRAAGRRARALAAAIGATIGATIGAACASPGMPPGGPPDVAPPLLTGVSPDSNAVGVKASSIVLRFNEVVSERSGGTGRGSFGTAGTLDALVRLSPSDGHDKVTWRRTAIEVEPRGGFRPNTTYRLTLLPGLADLRGNAVRQAQDLVFTTGDSIAEGVLSGAIFDWAAGRTAPLARVEAYLDADTTFRWVTTADSTGRFTLRDLAPARYHVRAWIDATANRQLDEREAFDSATVAIALTAENDFYAFVHDTVGPRIEVVEPVDSLALRIRFDRATSLEWTPDSTSLVLQGADSARIAFVLVVPATRYDSLARIERARADSVRAAADTTRAAADSVRPPPQVTARVAGPASDTSRAGPRLARPVPVQNWVLTLRAPLAPGDYRVTANRAEGLSGARRTSERQFRISPPPKPAERDSTAAAPVRPPPRPPPVRTP
jgi:hypothetical protein